MTHGAATRLLAAPILGERGGGVGQVSQLLWQAMRDQWGRSADLVTLLRNGNETPRLSEKWRFGFEMGGRQLFGRPEWILFSHLGLARIERYMPGRWSSPYAVFLHGIESWTPLPESDRDVLKRAALRVANSAFTARRVAEANPGIGDISVCPLALPDSIPTTESIRSRARTRPTVLVVGRLSSTERYKGHEELIRSWPAVETIVPGARLVIAGDGDDVDRLRALAAGLSKSGIEFTGFLSRPELTRHYRDATLFALPSRGEGFGLVYLEAMAAGLPCIGSVHDAASEVIVDGETGVLVDPDDVESMGQAIGRLLSQPRRAQEMGDAGLARLRGTFSYEGFRERMSALLTRAFGGHASGQGH